MDRNSGRHSLRCLWSTGWWPKSDDAASFTSFRHFRHSATVGIQFETHFQIDSERLFDRIQSEYANGRRRDRRCSGGNLFSHECRTATDADEISLRFQSSRFVEMRSRNHPSKTSPKTRRNLFSCLSFRSNRKVSPIATV